MMSSLKAGFCIIMALGAGSTVYAERGDPIYVANQNPFVQIFGLPKAEPGTITPSGKLDVGFLYFVSNNSISADAGNESIIWDGETAQYNLKLRYGVSDRLELGMDIPYIDHSGGYLDSLIRNFHDLFGITNERQEGFDKNQIHYQLRENGTTTFEMTDRARGFGDIRFSAAIPLIGRSEQKQRFLALRPQIKLPTGDADELLGSGGTDVSMGLSYSDFQTLSSLNMVLTSHAGVLYMGNTKVLRDKQKHFAGYGGISLAWLVMKSLEFKIQMDLHSALYNSDLKQLGSSLQLLGGGTAHLPGKVLLDLGMSQQLLTDSTPDVGFYLMLRRLF